MAKNASYSVKFRRRREGKTNYKRRLALLKSNKHRLVVRVSSNRVLAQIVAYHDLGDKVIISKSSDTLRKMGWTGSVKNLPAAYLTGLLIGKDSPIKELVLDSGIAYPSSRVYALVKGVADAGINVFLSEKVVPSEERISGAHINDSTVKMFNTVKEKILSGEKTVKKSKPVKKSKKVEE